MRGADDLGGETETAPEYLSISQLAEHEDAIQEWLEADPEMGARTLCSKMLSDKGCHVKPMTAQNYLIRLRRPAETPTRRNRRAMRGSSSAMGDVTPAIRWYLSFEVAQEWIQSMKPKCSAERMRLWMRRPYNMAQCRGRKRRLILR